MEKNYWMHRISHEGEIKQLILNNDNLLVTGWSIISTDYFLQQTKDLSRVGFSKIYEKEFGQLTRNRFCLYMFLNEFKEGDYVVVPGAGNFSVYEIVGHSPISKEHIWEQVNSKEVKNALQYCNGKYYNQSGKELDLGFCWQVKPIKRDIERNGFTSNNLRRRLKFQMTNINLTDLAYDIENAIKAKTTGNVVKIKDEIENGTSDTILEILRSKINDSDFEKVVKWYLERLGATSAHIPAKKNLSTSQGDADVIALFDELRIAVFVQVKQYDHIVGKKALDQIVRAYETYKDKYPAYTPILWVVTTCNSFSQDAEDCAIEKNVRCINGDEFARMILEIGINDLYI